MSTGLFMGIKSSFTDEAQDSALIFIDAINRALADRGLPRYLDPATPPHIYSGHLFGRSALDHHSSRVLASIANFGSVSKECPNLALIRDNPFRVAFLPIDFSPPLQTRYLEQIQEDRIEIWVGSLLRLHMELSSVASDLGIPLKNWSLTDDVAANINQFKLLYEGDSAELAEDERTAWLALYEGTRLALEHNVALSLAG